LYVTGTVATYGTANVAAAASGKMETAARRNNDVSPIYDWQAAKLVASESNAVVDHRRNTITVTQQCRGPHA